MRVIREMTFDDIRVSVFHMNGKYLLKFEQHQLEQTYKLSELDYLIRDTDEAAMAAEKILPAAKAIFISMHEGASIAFSDFAL
ncbi:MAG: hypothetical protein ACK5JC_07560 [Bacteroidota bacterium]|jgi:hypothetical protein